MVKSRQSEGWDEDLKLESSGWDDDDLIESVWSEAHEALANLENRLTRRGKPERGMRRSQSWV